MSGASRRSDLIKDSEVQTQCARFLDLLADATGSGNSIQSTAYEQLRQMLGEGFAKAGAARLYAHRDGDFCLVDQEAAVYRDKRGTQSVKLVFEDPEPDIELFTDEAKVSQVLRNFISNALKFTERGEVRVSVSQALNGALSFSVADAGIGIAEQDQERFQEWSQVEGKLQKAAKGSGLGLPLSRKLAQLLGGNVFVSSTSGLGSTFVAVIPVNFDGGTEVVYVPEVNKGIDSSRLPVLVLEDNREALFLYEKYLKGSRMR